MTKHFQVLFAHNNVRVEMPLLFFCVVLSSSICLLCKVFVSRIFLHQNGARPLSCIPHLSALLQSSTSSDHHNFCAEAFLVFTKCAFFSMLPRKRCICRSHTPINCQVRHELSGCFSRRFVFSAVFLLVPCMCDRRPGVVLLWPIGNNALNESTITVS